MNTKIFNINGKEEGTFTLPTEMFGAKVNAHFLHEVITAYLSNQRAGTAKTKTRAEVRGGGKKPWKQKGTGRARAGSTRSPIWVKGGTAFGPKPRDFGVVLPKSKKKSALYQALSTKHAEGNFIVLSNLEVKDNKTKNMTNILDTFKVGRKPLVVLTVDDKQAYLCGRNIEKLNMMLASDINCYALLNSSKVLITKKALETFLETHKVAKKAPTKKAVSKKLAPAKADKKAETKQDTNSELKEGKDV